MKEKSSFKTATEIAKHYLTLNPREVSYRVDLSSTEDDSEDYYYHCLNEDEKAIVQKWCDLTEDDDMYGVFLDEYLQNNGYEKLAERLGQHNTFLELNIVSSCDLTDAVKLFHFKLYFFYEKRESMSKAIDASCPLDDDEYAILLACHLMDKDMTINKLFDVCPEIMNKIHSHALGLFLGCHDTPFILSFTEMKETANKIMNPRHDILGLYKSKNAKIKSFIEPHAFLPGWVDLFDESNETGCFHVFAGFEGNKFCVKQERITCKFMDDQWSDEDEQSFDANILCQQLNLNDYEDLLNYMIDHFNTATALNDIREFVKANCNVSD